MTDITNDDDKGNTTQFLATLSLSFSLSLKEKHQSVVPSPDNELSCSLRSKCFKSTDLSFARGGFFSFAKLRVSHGIGDMIYGHRIFRQHIDENLLGFHAVSTDFIEVFLCCVFYSRLNKEKIEILMGSISNITYIYVYMLEDAGIGYGHPNTIDYS